MKVGQYSVMLAGSAALLLFTGCSSLWITEEITVERPIISEQAEPPPGTVRYCWEEPKVAYEPNGPGVDVDGKWYHPYYVAVREVKMGRWIRAAGEGRYMKAKKVISFLLLLPAFNSKNISSILLVLVFFLIYYVAGGKVSWVPDVQSGSGFGSIDTGNVTGDVVPAGQQPMAAALNAPAPVMPAASAQLELPAPAPAVSEESRKLDELYERLKKRQ